MLASITPLGERSRQSRWGRTAGSYLVSSSLAGAAVGAALGGVGALVARTGAITPVVAGVGIAAAAGLGALSDLGRLPWPLPSPRRQVNEEWLGRYRDWVYGAGFGAQLGAGVVTIVTTAAVYLTLLLAFITVSPAGGAAVGGTFGLARGASILVAGGIERPGQLRRFHGRMNDHRHAARRGAVAAQVALAAAAATLVVW